MCLIFKLIYKLIMSTVLMMWPQKRIAALMYGKRVLGPVRVALEMVKASYGDLLGDEAVAKSK